MTGNGHLTCTSRARWFIWSVLVGCLVAAGCVPTALKRPGLPDHISSAKVLIMDPDVELSVLTAGGLQEPNAQWTEQGYKNVNGALAVVMQETDVNMVRYVAPAQDSESFRRHHQLNKLYEAVGVSILLHKYNEVAKLPTKADRFDWTLGADTVRELRQEYDADYALFVYLHDSYASAGRVGVILVAAVFGVGISGGIQIGFSSLVDLKTGEVVWFNRLVSTTGDLRTPEPARKAVETLLTELPVL